MNAALERIQNAVGIITGQHVGAGSFPTGWETYITALKTTTGRTPLLVGADFGWGGWSAEWLQRLVAHYRAGGLVAISWHAPNPFTGGPDTDLARGSVDELLTDGTKANSRFTAALAQQGVRLAYLQAAGVTAIFRPWHEANGQWAWWQNWQPDDYRRLWQYTYQFMAARGLVLAWLFSPNRWYYGLARPEAYYPGPEWCDLVGLDHYGNNLDGVPAGGYTALVGLGKPFILSEFGPGSGGSEPAAGSFDYGTLLNMLQARCHLARGFMAWNGNYALIRQRNATALLNDPRAATLESAPVTVHPTATISATVKRAWPWPWWKITLTWSTSNATGAVLNGKSVPFNGSQTRYVSRGTYDYVLVATRGSEAGSAAVTVRAG